MGVPKGVEADAARDGYDQVTVDAVARGAGPSRLIVYRRWPSKVDVVFDAAFQVNDASEISTGTGDHR